LGCLQRLDDQLLNYTLRNISRHGRDCISCGTGFLVAYSLGMQQVISALDNRYWKEDISPEVRVSYNLCGFYS